MGKGQKRFPEPKTAEKPSEQGKETETNRQLPQASDEAKESPQHKAFKEMLRRCDSTIFKSRKHQGHVPRHRMCAVGKLASFPT